MILSEDVYNIQTEKLTYGLLRIYSHVLSLSDLINFQSYQRARKRVVEEYLYFSPTFILHSMCAKDSQTALTGQLLTAIPRGSSGYKIKLWSGFC